LLLEQIVTWMRRQSGTTSLRALLYFDEAFGFFPPVANPPSKRPLLTLFKQARAFGLGVVLTTQNPVDLDYKGLTNAGTWFIGKLQTEQDKARVLDGLESATAEVGGALNRRDLDRAISALGSRVFLLHNVHEDEPVVFHTRWAMSYLRGPMTRTQVRELMADVKADAAPDAGESEPARPSVRQDVTPAKVPDVLRGYSGEPPALPPSLEQVFLPVRTSSRQAMARLEEELGRRLDVKDTTLVYEPCLLALGKVSFVNQKRDVDETRELGLLVQAGDLGAVVRWADADPVDLRPRDLERDPEPDARFGPLSEELNTAAKIKAFGKDFGEYLYREQELEIFYNPVLELYGRPGEAERDFHVRAQQVARENRDAEVEKLRQKAEREVDRLEERLAREERDLAREEAQYDARKREELISAGESLVGLLGVFGGRRSSRSLSRAATKRRLTAEAKADVSEAEAAVERLEEQIEELRQEMEADADAITRKWADTLDEIETYTVHPRRVDVDVQVVTLAWAPYWEIGTLSARGDVTHDGVPAWG
jgi:hypothetical protein